MGVLLNFTLPCDCQPPHFAKMLRFMQESAEPREINFERFSYWPAVMIWSDDEIAPKMILRCFTMGCTAELPCRHKRMPATWESGRRAGVVRGGKNSRICRRREVAKKENRTRMRVSEWVEKRNPDLFTIFRQRILFFHQPSKMPSNGVLTPFARGANLFFDFFATISCSSFLLLHCQTARK